VARLVNRRKAEELVEVCTQEEGVELCIPVEGVCRQGPCKQEEGEGRRQVVDCIPEEEGEERTQVRVRTQAEECTQDTFYGLCDKRPKSLKS
jgi:hypothetical protein